MLAPDKLYGDSDCSGGGTFRSLTTMFCSPYADRDGEGAEASRKAGLAARRGFGEPWRGVVVLERWVVGMAAQVSPPAVAAADTAAAILP